MALKSRCKVKVFTLTAVKHLRVPRSFLLVGTKNRPVAVSGQTLLIAFIRRPSILNRAGLPVPMLRFKQKARPVRGLVLITSIPRFWPVRSCFSSSEIDAPFRFLESDK